MPKVATIQMKRYSLRSVLIGVAIISVLLGIGLLQSRNRSLVEEVERLRSEVGHLVPVDRSKVNIIEVPTNEQFVWRWRVFAPPGTSFDGGIATSEIPQKGTPSPSFGGVRLPSVSNGSLITASVVKDIDEGYVLTLDFGGGNQLRQPTVQSLPEFLIGSATTTTAGERGVQVCEFEKPIILHSRRLIERTFPATGNAPKETARGVLFWITPHEK